MLRAMEAEYAAFAGYRPSVYAGEAILFRAADRAGLTTDSPTNGRGEWLQGRLTVIEVGGNHHEIMQSPHVNVIAEALRNCDTILA